MRGLVGRLELDELARLLQRRLGIAGELRDQRALDRGMQLARVLAPRGAPGLEAVGVAQLEPLEQLAAEEGRPFTEVGDAGPIKALRLERFGGAQVDHRRPRVDAHPLAIGDDPLPSLLVEQRPQPREAPAERAARVVGQVPEERAEVLAGLLAPLDEEIPEQRAGLLRGRQVEPLAAALDADAPQHAQRERLPCRGVRAPRAPAHLRLRAGQM